MSSHFIIYKTTNKIDGKFYIGQHQTKKLDDDYFGSGKYLLAAVNKHGKENFKKEILFVFETEQEMNQKERELVTEEFCKRKDTYNICPGGFGGFGYINQNKEYYNKIIMNKWYSLSEKEKQTINIKKALPGKLNGMFGIRRNNTLNPMFGKTHSEITKEKIRQKAIGRKITTQHKEKIKQNTLNLWNDLEWRKKQIQKQKQGWNEEKRKSVSEQMSGMLWWNNGKIQKRLRECPGIDWIRGRLR